MSKQSCGTLVLIVFLVWVLAIVGGQLMASQFIQVQKAACGVLQSGVDSIGNNPEPSQTEAKCVKLATAAEPLTRLYAVFFASVATVILCGGAFVLINAILFFTR
jgi:hypothetical protein